MSKDKFVKLFRNFSVAAAIIMIWRGIWYAMDKIDIMLFGGSHLWTAAIGIIIGIAILYWPDHNLDELGKL